MSVFNNRKDMAMGATSLINPLANTPFVVSPDTITPVTPPSESFLLAQTGSFVLNQSGGKIVLN